MVNNNYDTYTAVLFWNSVPKKRQKSDKEGEIFLRKQLKVNRFNSGILNLQIAGEKNIELLNTHSETELHFIFEKLTFLVTSLHVILFWNNQWLRERLCDKYV